MHIIKERAKLIKFTTVHSIISWTSPMNVSDIKFPFYKSLNKIKISSMNIGDDWDRACLSLTKMNK